MIVLFQLLFNILKIPTFWIYITYKNYIKIRKKNLKYYKLLVIINLIVLLIIIF